MRAGILAWAANNRPRGTSEDSHGAGSLGGTSSTANSRSPSVVPAWCSMRLAASRTSSSNACARVAIAGTTLGDLEFAVEDVPPSDPAPWESSEVPLGRLFAAQGKMPARIVGPGLDRPAVD